MRLFSAILCFVFWVISCPLAYAFEINHYLHAVPRQKTLSAKITANTAGPAQPIVYYIHDVHAHKDAQKTIGTLVKNIQSKTKIDFIGVEGFEGTVLLESLRRYADKDLLRVAADYLLQKNRISGVVHTALLSDEPVPPLIGIEESDLYRQHIETYKDAQPLASSLLETLSREKDHLRGQEDVKLNETLRTFQKNARSYSRGELSLAEYLAHMEKSGAALPEAIRLYQRLLALEKSVSLPKVEVEKPAFLARLAAKVDSLEQKELVALSNEFKGGRLSNSEFFQKLQTLAEKKGISLSGYPHLSRYMDYVKLLGRVDTAQFPEDILNAEKAAYARLIKTPVEQLFIDHERFLDLSQKLVSLGLAPSEWAEYKNKKTKFSNGVASSLALFERFYEKAQERNITLASNIEKSITATKAQAGIVVAGGFHFEEIRRMLEEKGIGLISVIPSFSIGDQNLSAASYLKNVSSQPSILENVLAGSVWTLAPPAAQGIGVIPGVLAAVQDALVNREKAGEDVREFRAGTVITRVEISGSRNTSDLRIGHARARWYPRPNISAALNAMKRYAHAIFIYVWRVPSRLIAISVLLYRVPALRRATLALPLGALLFVCGCAAPEHPERKIPFGIPSEFVSPGHVPGDFQYGWLKTFNDPQLANLIDEAMKHNVGLKVIDSVSAAKALVDQAEAGLFPQINLTGFSTNSKSLSEPSEIDSRLGGAIGTNWELDVWGRLGSIEKSAEARLRVAQFQYEDARQGLAVEVARAYFLLTASQMQQRVLEKQISDLEYLAKRAEEKNQTGVGQPVDVSLARSEVSVAKERLERFMFAQEKAARALEVLLGRYPSAILEAPSEFLPVPSPMPTGVPSDLLKRRAVVQAAWWSVESQYHAAESAYEARFPSLFINGQVNGSKIISQIPGITFPATYAWTVGASVFTPLLDWGKLAAAQDFQTELERTNLAVWIATVLGVFQDAENVLSEAQHLARQAAALQDAVDNKRDALSKLIARYKDGFEDIQRVIQIRRELSEIEMALIEVQNAIRANRATTQFVLGGTFDAPAVADTSQPNTSGGSWSTHSAYVPWAWLETPFVFGAVFVGQLIAGYFSAGLNLQYINALMWFVAPLLFYGGHFMGNRAGLMQETVLSLTGYKLLIATVGFLLSNSSFPLPTILFTTGILTFFVTVMHKNIQDRVVQAQIEGANQVPISSRDVLDRAKNGVLKYLPQIQAALQVKAAEDRRSHEIDVVPSSTEKPNLRVVVIDSGFADDVAAYVKKALAMGTDLKQQRILFLSDSDDIRHQISELAGNRTDVSVDAVPSIFEFSDKTTALSLSNLEAYMDGKGYFSSNPAVQIMARAELALLQEGLSSESRLRQALFFLLTKELAAVPFVFQSLSEIHSLARIIEQQA